MQNPSNILPKAKDDEWYYISPEGLSQICKDYDSLNPLKNVQWTTDYRRELPIKMSKQGVNSLPPYTFIEIFKQAVSKFGNQPALTTKKDGKWFSLNYSQYYEISCQFAQALLSLGITPYSSVNIIGFNAVEWFISFFGSIFGYYLPVGIYTTNGQEACQYIAQNSDCEVVVAENRQQLQKYIQIWDKLPNLKYIIVYNDIIPDASLPDSRRGQIIQWDQFLELGRNYVPKTQEESLEFRMRQQKPGNCCTLVYTSGTTGPPKGVMLTHDNYLWKSIQSVMVLGLGPGMKVISYLPLGHVASQTVDIIIPLIGGLEVYFCTPESLQGSLVAILREIRPTFFFSVPRVWEKIEEAIKAQFKNSGFPKSQIANWAMGIGKAGTFAELNGRPLPYCFGLAKSLIYNKIKFAIGLDQAKMLSFGAAPLAPSTIDFFLSINMCLRNAYGMSECSGAQTSLDPTNFDEFGEDFRKSCGKSVEGSELRIMNPDADGNGEICYKGRHVFKGYYKNEQATRDTLDSDGFLHSGDVGRLDAKGNLYITGRLKELLVTSGGENVAPLIIENNIREQLNYISNCIVVGDGRRFLSVLLTLKHEVDKNGRVTSNLSQEVLSEFQKLGSTAKSVTEARSDQIVNNAIKAGIDRANAKSISKAQQVHKWVIIDGDFSVEGGELTPTLKTKRKFISDKYLPEIDSIYQFAKF